jgi:transposase
MQLVIHPRSNRKQPRQHDKHIYSLRYLVESAFMRLKQWRGIAIRYAERSSSFFAAVQFRCALLWACIS